MTGYGDVTYGSAPYGGSDDAAVPSTVTGGRASETDAAHPGIAVTGSVVPGGEAAETDTGRPSAVAQSAQGAEASEIDTARPGTVSQSTVISGGEAAETDAARAATALVGARIDGGEATETDAASPGRATSSYVGGIAHEDDSAIPGVKPYKHRWTWYDPKNDVTWEMGRNPHQMTSPHPGKNTVIFAKGMNTIEPNGSIRKGISRVLQFRAQPFQWSFTGKIRDEHEYNVFRHWVHKTQRLHITDHLGRTWELRIESVDLDELRPNIRRSHRFDYTVRTILYGRVR